MRQNFVNQQFRDVNPSETSVFPWNDKFPYEIPPCEGGGGTLQTVTEAGNTTNQGISVTDNEIEARDTVSLTGIGLQPSAIVGKGQPVKVGHNEASPLTVVTSVNNAEADTDGNVLLLFDGSGNADVANTEGTPNVLELTQHGIEKTLNEYNSYQRRKLYQYFCEFVSPIAVNASDGNGLVVFTAGASASYAQTSNTDPNRIGVATLSTGTTATGKCTVYTGLQYPIALGGGNLVFECDIFINTLADTAERFVVQAGLFRAIDTYQSDGVLLCYDPYQAQTGMPANTGNWYTFKGNNGTRSFEDTGFPAVAGAWAKLKVEVSPSLVASFSINDTPVGSVNATNVPPSSRPLSFGVQILKTLGTTARLVTIDYVSVSLLRTTER